jgi:hypothetical protein
MPTASTLKRADFWVAALGFAFLCTIHLVGLSEIPGLHFDEAWAMNYAHSLITAPLTTEAMSPYTAPWAHYWAAGWMAMFGPSVFVFRLSQVALAMQGFLLTAFALRKRGQGTAAAYLFPVAALLPGLVLNGRFAIELNGLHVFCLGALFFGLCFRRPWIAALAFLIGTTGHILFYGVGLGLVGAAIWSGRSFSKKERAAAMAAFLLMAAFFTKVWLAVPEKNKAIALVASGLSMAGLLAVKAERWKLWTLQIWSWIAGLGAAVFGFNALFFADGIWSLAITTGKQSWKGVGIISLLLFAPGFAWLLWRGSKEMPRVLLRAGWLTLIALGLMMLKPAPRYFEVVLVGFAVIASLSVSRFTPPLRALVLAAMLVHALPTYVPYFSEIPHEAEFRFLFFKDSSRDFLSKQKLSAVLGGMGCGLSGIEMGDSRVFESLLAISLTDWPKADRACPWAKLRVERKAEASRAGASGETADFLFWGS